jgi:eukaryotic-like serine/threonine-protein kinase
MPNSPDEPDRTLSHLARPAGEARPFVGAVAGYTLVRELGRGGMGVVYEALDPGTGRLVALKVLDLEGRGYDLDLALREARVMAKVSHPNTVFLYRAERCDFGLLLAMEIVRGGTVADLLRREGRLSPPRAVDLALQLVGGLRAYDAHGIVHRDIKPSNCFLDRDGRARIGDLGLSRSSETVSRLTREGRFLGTPHYSSPEQLRGEVVDRRSDIYSLGATLYEMIAGRPPIDAPDGVTLVARIMSEEPPPLAGRVPDVPPGLDAAIRRALAKDRERRFATYEQLAEALAPFGATSPPVAGVGTRIAAAFGDVGLFVFLPGQ